MRGNPAAIARHDSRHGGDARRQGEVQTGHYLEEDDIVRYEDIDARV